MQPSGRARSESEIVDLSILLATGFTGVSAVIGETERGEHGKSVLIGSWSDYRRYFGELSERWATPNTGMFPLLCKRALEAGARLLITRAGHYATITDKTTLAGTKPTITVGTIVITGKSVGNYVATYAFTAAASRLAGKFDLTESIANYPELTHTIKDIAAIITADDALTLNSKLFVSNLAAGTISGAASGSLAGGSETLGSIAEADYIGDASAGTGIHVFDNDTNFDYICVPHKASSTLDTAVSAYADARQDCQSMHRTAVGVDGSTATTYRDATSIDTWRSRMFTGGLIITHPVTSLETEIPEIGDVLGVLARKDNKTKKWFAAAGQKRGRIKNALGVVFNFGTAGRSAQADSIDIAGINQVIKHPTFGVVVWGNSTLQKNDTLLKHANVADLIMFVQKTTKPCIDTELFDPNDMDTWKNIYRGVKQVMDAVQNGRGCWRWLYQGDQDAETVADCLINAPANIDLGQYIFNLWVAPKVGMKYVGMKVVVTNSGVKFEELAGQPD